MPVLPSAGAASLKGAFVPLGLLVGTGSYNAPIFSNIPQVYTDLMMIVHARQTGDALISQGVLRINDDNGANYSWTSVITTGVNPGNTYTNTSTRESNSGNGFTIYDFPASMGLIDTFGTSVIHIMNYANTTTKKTVIWRNGNNLNGLGSGRMAIGTWNSLSAINDVRLISNQGNFADGCTFSLYGVRSVGQ